MEEEEDRKKERLMTCDATVIQKFSGLISLHGWIWQVMKEGVEKALFRWPPFPCRDLAAWLTT